MTTIEQVKAKIRTFLQGYQLGANPYEIFKYASMTSTSWGEDQPWGVSSSHAHAEGFKAFAGIYNKDNAKSHFIFSATKNKDFYEINYELLNDNIEFVKKNGKIITDAAECEAIFQFLIKDLAMPSAEQFQKAKEAQLQDKIGQDFKKRNKVLVTAGTTLAIIASVMGVIFTGPIGLLLGAGIVLGVCVIGSYTGLFDSKEKREKKVQDVFNEENAVNVKMLKPVAPVVDSKPLESPKPQSKKEEDVNIYHNTPSKLIENPPTDEVYKDVGSLLLGKGYYYPNIAKKPDPTKGFELILDVNFPDGGKFLDIKIKFDKGVWSFVQNGKEVLGIDQAYLIKSIADFSLPEKASNTRRLKP